MSFLEAKNLIVEFPGRQGTLSAFDAISFFIAPGEIFCAVWESVAGKSLKRARMIGWLEPLSFIDNLRLDQRRHIQGKRSDAIFQDRPTLLNPFQNVCHQLTQTISEHFPPPVKEAFECAIFKHNDTGILGIQMRVDHYPHQFSEDECERTSVAQALATNHAVQETLP